MALSYYYNWPDNTAAVTPLFRLPSPVPEMFSLNEDPTFYDTGINPIFEQSYSNYSDNILAPTGNVFTPSPEFQVSSFTYQDPYYTLPYSTSFNYQEQLFPVEYAMVPKLPSELPPRPESGWDARPGGYGNGQVEGKRQNEGSLSAQSMAARVRRRKISEKTQELGKLVPGGQKMNTAEMFQAAFKYIKFLQAQIGVLKLMPSLPESEEVLSNGEMQALVTCTLMQEKLYTAEKCIGPNTLQKLSK
ncbi:hypothetical protein L1987_22809 [Smallanthus sonchifolius]|uniref:Uncharacterized protein n=1 Tax=Smallanthus sonchifolius TaxID=185202 RepID=A0ACB9IHC7_9ASTR|nr:hypothetical protein L1987_22809 [Smallanthus sonchifolius]